jgi:hypothetical protein
LRITESSSSFLLFLRCIVVDPCRCPTRAVRGEINCGTIRLLQVFGLPVHPAADTSTWGSTGGFATEADFRAVGQCGVAVARPLAVVVVLTLAYVGEHGTVTATPTLFDWLVVVVLAPIGNSTAVTSTLVHAFDHNFLEIVVVDLLAPFDMSYSSSTAAFNTYNIYV